MRKHYVKRGIALALVAVTVFGTCACGKKDSDSKSQADGHYFLAEYMDDLPASYGDGVMQVKFHGDTMFYAGYNSDYTQIGVYGYNLLTKEETTYYVSEKNEEGDIFGETTNVQTFCVDNEENVYVYFLKSTVDPESVGDYENATLDDVVDYMATNWGYDENTAVEDWNNYYAADYTAEDGTVQYGKFLTNMSCTYIYNNEICKFSPAGDLVWSTDLGESMNGEWNVSCYSMAVTPEGNVVTLTDKYDVNGNQEVYYLTLYDKDGNQEKDIDVDTYYGSVCSLPDGKIAISGWSDTGSQLTEIDLESGALGEVLDIPNENFAVLDENTLLLNSGSQLDEYNIKTGETSKYLTWLNYNIASSSIQSYGVLSDGQIVVVTNYYDMANSKNEVGVVMLTECDAKDVPDVNEIHIASMWISSDMEQQIISFNKKHTDVRIVLDQYYDYNSNDWEGMIEKFNTALVSDKNIDMVYFEDYSQVNSMAAKGLLMDMYELMDGDSSIKKEDFIPSVLTNCEKDGKLVVLPRTFCVDTLVAKSELVGDKPGWTVSDVQNLLTMNPDCQFLYGTERASIMRTLISLNYSKFVDDSGKCDFNNEEFVQILEIANMFPETFDWSEDTDVTTLLHEGKVLCTETYMGEFSDSRLNKSVFGGDITYIGFPTAEGNGALMNLNNMIGVTKNCEDTAAAWEFITSLYEANADGTYGDYSWGFPVIEKDFDTFCKKAMEGGTQSGGIMAWGDYEVEDGPITQEEIDAAKEVIYNTTAVNGAVSDAILNIILEEADYYFNGSQSAESVAEKVQSRMEIYLSETR